ncbi:hypothetical protein EYF80_046080 [Liparis tanakae]|uniref:Uncharacterized protein n=1 Tax=Liparis tanakae TaxID=230148 RepID=A0A4Z2FS40_9TELE|nr:hypothetical protein EYF80_046080 [Liparis tanakae]
MLGRQGSTVVQSSVGFGERTQLLPPTGKTQRKDKGGSPLRASPTMKHQTDTPASTADMRAHGIHRARVVSWETGRNIGNMEA